MNLFHALVSLNLKIDVLMMKILLLAGNNAPIPPSQQRRQQVLHMSQLFTHQI